MTLRFISISAVAWHAKSDASCINSPDLTTCSTKGSALLQRQTGDLGKTTVTDNGDPSSKDLETRLKAVETQQSEDHRSIKDLDDRSSQSESEIKALDDRSSQSESEIKALDDRMEAAKGPQKLTKPKATQPEKGKTTDCSQMWWDSEHSLMTGPGTISGTPGSTKCAEPQTACYDARKDGKCVVNSPCVMTTGNNGYVRCNAKGPKSREDKARDDKARDDKAREAKAREARAKAREAKAREAKAREDKKATIKACARPCTKSKCAAMAPSKGRGQTWKQQKAMWSDFEKCRDVCRTDCKKKYIDEKKGGEKIVADPVG